MSFLSCLPFGFLHHRKHGGRYGSLEAQPSNTVGTAESHQKHSSTMTIEKLPLEMLQMIASFLAPDSAACFILCSKFLQRAIGRRSWLDLRNQDQKKARLRFLIVLQRDLPEWLPCYHCEKLNRFSLPPLPPPPWRYENEHPCAYADGYLCLRPLLGMQFQYAQMIMKLHKLRATENIFLDSLSCDHSFRYRGHVADCHTSARIRKDELLVKIEWRIFIRHGESFEIGSLCQSLCPHWFCLLDDDNLTRRIRCQMSHTPGQTCPECTGMVQCQFCSTEFIVAFLNSNWSRKGQAIYLTAWKNLGPCDTPFQISWRTQLHRVHSSGPTPTCWVPFVPGSIRREFEEFTDSRIGVHGLSIKRPLNSDVEFSRMVADIGRETD